MSFATLGQSVVIVAVAAGVALGSNALRGKNRINLLRDYSARPNLVTTLAAIEPTGAASPTPTAAAPLPAAQTGLRQVTSPPVAAASSEAIPTVSFEQVKELHASPERLAGATVFVDARNDEAYQKGHLPGAVQCDFYRIEHYLGPVLERALAATRVIVYCNGGDCEDSLLVCGELLRAGVPRENVFLFKDGYQSWVQQGMPVKTGAEAE